MALFALAALQSLQLCVLYLGIVQAIGRRAELKQVAPLAAFAALPVLGMLAFWLIWLFSASAIAINAAIWIATAIALWRIRGGGLDRDAVTAAGLWALATVCLLVWAFGSTGLEGMPDVARTRFSHPLPGDNVIPLDFARGLLAGAVPSPLHADWLSSDRPPLQTGLFLALRIPAVPLTAAYQTFSTSLQMAVIPAAYLFVRLFGGSTKVSALGAAIIFFAPITIINGTFVWPKLITSALLIAAGAWHFGPTYPRLRSSALAGAILGILSAGAMLSHGAAAFTLLAFAIVAFVSGRWGSVRYSVCAIGCLLTLYLPWMGYQQFVDPPGDRLLRYQFAEALDAHDDRSLPETIQDAYRGMSFEEVVGRNRFKLELSLQHLLSPVPTVNFEGMRSAMFFRPLISGGILASVGLAAIFAAFCFGAGHLAASLVINWLIWSISLFNTGGVVTHQSSFWMILILPLLAIIALRRYPGVLYFSLGLQVCITFIFLPYN